MTAHALRPEDVTLHLLVTPGRAERLGRVVDALLADPVVGAMPFRVLVPADILDEVAGTLEQLELTPVVVPSAKRKKVAKAVVAGLPTLGTPAFAAVRLPRRREVPELSAALDAARRGGITDAPGDVAAGGAPALPRLLAVEQTLMRVLPAYERARAASASLEALAAAVGDPPDLTTGGRLESVDAVPGGVRIGIWLNAALPPELPEPPWRLEVVLVGRGAVVAASAPTPLRRRVDRFGVWRYDEVVAEVPLRDVPDGDYTFGLRTPADATPDGTPPEPGRVGSRQGPLLSGRPLLVDVEGADPVRVLVHSARRGSGAALLVRHGDDDAARDRWRATMRRFDRDFVLRYRRSMRMRMLRLARLLTRPLFARRDVWLVGERPDTAQDNGMHLFRHLRTTAPGRDVYYVIDPSSPQAERVRDLGHVVAHSSVRHRLLTLHASVLADAYSIHHMLPSQWDAGQYARHLAWRVGALRVYLKHGVHLSPEAVKRGSAGYDVFLTATRRETELVRAVTGYDAQVAQTGLPRYDALVPTPPSRTVLFMSTWRRYLVPRLFSTGEPAQDGFTGSSYEAFVRALLGSERLAEVLRRYDYRLEFLPHYNLAGPVAGLPTADERIAIADPDALPIQEQLRRCDLLVTDYSSVHFDVAYMGTPVVYSRFDEEEYETKHASPSWFDYDREGFGPVARTLDGTIDAIEDALARGCTVEPRYAARVDEAFGVRDRENCARVVAEIDARLAVVRAAAP